MIDRKDGEHDSARVFRQWPDSPCQSPNERHFHIFGKPGSGKSTFLKYLEKNLRTHHCPHWSLGDDPFIFSYFVWNMGRGLQKSFKGLLQAIFYQCLSSCPWTIETAVSDSRSNLGDTTPTTEWSLQELRYAIEACLDRISVSHKCLLLLDGLDELQEDEFMMQETLKFLRNLTRIAGIKICTSSRPWNILTSSRTSVL